MGTQYVPTIVTDDNPNQNPDSEPVESITEEKQVLQENARETFLGSTFANMEPIREEQVQNAVKFLSHPKVRGSPVVYRRSFLEKKGLTKEEIDEAFVRVPDLSPSVTITQGNNQSQDRQVEAATNSQQQVSTQTPQPVVAKPPGVVFTKTILRPARFHWSHAFLAMGFLVAWGTGTALLFKNVLVPRLKSWICKVVLGEEKSSIKKRDCKPCLVEEVAAAAKAAAAAATDMARASQKMISSKSEGWGVADVLVWKVGVFVFTEPKGAFSGLVQTQRRYLESFRNVLDVQVGELKSMSKAIRKLEAMNSPSASVEPAGSSYLKPNKAPEISLGQNTARAKAQDAGPWWLQKSAWVPPQPPPIAMPEAAAAIRQRKSVIQAEQSNVSNHLISYPSNDFAELQTITKISESGGEIEMIATKIVNETQEER